MADVLCKAGVATTFDDHVGGPVHLRWARPSEGSPEAAAVPSASQPVTPGNGPAHESHRAQAKPEEASSTGHPDLDAQGEVLYWAITVLALFFPAVAREVIPGGEIGNKGDVFWSVFLVTLPFSGLLTLIFLMWLREWADTVEQRLGWTAAGLIASGFVGWGFGTQLADIEFLSGTNGHPVVVVLAAVFYVLFTYAVIYGGALFVAGIASAAWAAWWLHGKLPADI